MTMRPFQILLVEDNPGDARLTTEAFRQGKVYYQLDVVEDGNEALDFLYRRPPYTDQTRPDIILLDLNLPGMDGREVLAHIKADESLRRIPVVILTSSKAEADILKSYDLHANCYITKPVHLQEFLRIVLYIEDFWLTIVRLPQE